MQTALPPPAFLDPREIARSCASAQLGQVATQTLLDLAQRIAADPAVCNIGDETARCTPPLECVV